ncbi:anti-sigma factor [Pseudogulbenkiania sp. MAI-1]|uniref:anti-sigma factor family protein n=1 Tax=Pseudogulbenkiania sp. MAI-1 TaxID=990370 RepID=UPI00045E706A|nr:anti-sigma factor [Pseudogulbenkiania sp. MAI-1]
MTEPSEQMLQAYLDGELPVHQIAWVEAWVAAHPAVAGRLARLRRQDEALRQLLRLPESEPMPLGLLDAAKPPGRRDRHAWLRQAMAASLVFALGVGGGWYGQSYLRQAVQVPDGAYVADNLPRQAAMAHVVYSPDIRRPVEIGAEQEGQLVAWLSRRMHSRIEPPKLAAAGYELIGGRLLPGSQGPVAQFMYHDVAGQRMTLYVATETRPRADEGFRFTSQGPVNVYYWWGNGFGYALSAGMPRDKLLALAERVHLQLKEGCGGRC